MKSKKGVMMSFADPADDYKTKTKFVTGNEPGTGRFSNLVLTAKNGTITGLGPGVWALGPGLSPMISKAIEIEKMTQGLTPEQKAEAIQLSTTTELSMLEAIAYVQEREGVDMKIAEALVNAGWNRLSAVRMAKVNPMSAWATAHREIEVTYNYPDLDTLQAEHGHWLAKLGSQPVDLQMRLRRFVEEAAELTQAAGLDFLTFIKVAADSYSRPEGEVHQELGGTMVTLLCLANVLGLSTWGEAVREFNRINTPEMIEKIAAKQKVKAARGI